MEIQHHEYPTTMECTQCRAVKPTSTGFRLYTKKTVIEGRHVRKAYRYGKCKACESRYATKHQRANHLKRVFNLTLEDHADILDSQGGKCAICELSCPTGRRLAVDHCHTTGVVRGLLCSRCNTGLGQFKDSQQLLASAILYLRGTPIEEHGVMEQSRTEGGLDDEA